MQIEIVTVATRTLTAALPHTDRFEDVQGSVLEVEDFDELLPELRAALIIVASYLVEKVFGQDPRSPTFTEDVRSILTSGHLYLVVIEDFPALLRRHRIYESEYGRLLLLMGILVHPSYRRRSLAHKSYCGILSAVNPTYLATRTQNPLLFDVLSRYVSDLWPKPSKQEIPFLVSKVAEIFAKELGSIQFNPTSLVDAGTYGEATHSENFRQFSKIQEVNAMFESLIVREKGDSVLLIGEV